MRNQTAACAVLACGLFFSALVSATRVEITDEEVDIQSRAYPAALGFHEALQKAIANFLLDDDDSEGPLAQLKNKHLSDAEAKNILNILMNEHSSVLTLLNAESPVAPRGESIEKNWIFRLYIDELADYCFYAVVDRYEAVPTYNYGFN